MIYRLAYSNVNSADWCVLFWSRKGSGPCEMLLTVTVCDVPSAGAADVSDFVFSFALTLGHMVKRDNWWHFWDALRHVAEIINVVCLNGYSGCRWHESQANLLQYDVIWLVHKLTWLNRSRTDSCLSFLQKVFSQSMRGSKGRGCYYAMQSPLKQTLKTGYTNKINLPWWPETNNTSYFQS